MAKMTKKGKSSTYFMKLMMSVFSRMVKNCGVEKICRKYFRPAHSQAVLRL